MTTLSPGLDLLAAELEVGQRRTAHVRQRGLPADGLGDHRGDQLRMLAQLLVLVRVLVERQDRAGDGVTGGIVAADDQQDDIPEVLHRLHVPRRLAMGQHGDEVIARLGVHPVVPEADEAVEALHELLAPELKAGDTSVCLGWPSSRPTSR